eukprot:m.47794 g.47794  ORF g.47794 m.47794 type:complete len:539 (+) comp10534_c0_seq1:282-1898(+)
MEANVLKASPILHSVFTRNDKLVYENSAAKASSAHTPENIFASKEDWLKARKRLASGNTVLERVERNGSWFQIEAIADNDSIIITQSNISAVMEDLQYRDSVFRRVCHDLRAPLHGIVGLAEELIARAKRARDNPETAEAILYSGQRLGFMINDILDASKLKNKKMELNLSVVPLKREVGKVVYSLRSARDHSSGQSLVATGVTLRDDVSASLPNIKVDKHRLSQILYNLVGNACKFTTQGFVKIYAEKIQEKGKEFLKICVEDSGNGIAEDDLPRLFKEFGQANNEKSREFAGTGLGLSICKELVELHGGRIWVTSQLMKGSTFSFTMPTTTEKVTEEGGGVDEYRPSSETLELYGGDTGTWGTASFRYGTSGAGSYRSLIERAMARSSISGSTFGSANHSMEKLDEDLDRESWYVGPMDRSGAVKRLSSLPAGSFFVRKGSTGFVISVRYFRDKGDLNVFHIELNGNLVSKTPKAENSEMVLRYWVERDIKFDSIKDLVQYYMGHSEDFFKNLVGAKLLPGYHLTIFNEVEEVTYS